MKQNKLFINDKIDCYFSIHQRCPSPILITIIRTTRRFEHQANGFGVTIAPFMETTTKLTEKIAKCLEITTIFGEKDVMSLEITLKCMLKIASRLEILQTAMVVLQPR
jgi:hypothetical protein